MRIREINFQEDSWNEIINSFPDSHILQTWEWGKIKSLFGWNVHPYVWRNSADELLASALVLSRSISVPGNAYRFNVLYVPKGPLQMDWANGVIRQSVINDLSLMAKKLGAIFIKIDPDISLGTGLRGQDDYTEDPLGYEIQSELQKTGWIYSDEQVQFKNTVLINLLSKDEELLAKMKQKTRYNIRLAGRKGVVVRIGNASDLDTLYKLYAETSIRDGFVIRGKEYYHTVWSTYINAGMAKPLIAEVDGEVIASLILFYFSGRAWFLYGMSCNIHREKMPNYLLQWEAIRLAKSLGCTTYDLWGAPEKFDPQDPLWGVYRFKSGFGGTLVRHIGAWDLPVNPFFYRLYTRILPRALAILRRRGLDNTREQLSM